MEVRRVECAFATGGGTIGLHVEGVFRQAIHYKGRNRDTAWYSITDDEWPAIREAQRAWLRPENFDSDGRQRRSLSHFRS